MRWSSSQTALSPHSGPSALKSRFTRLGAAHGCGAACLAPPFGRLAQPRAVPAQPPQGRGRASSAAGRLGARPRATGLLPRRAGQAAVRGHRLRAHAPGAALPGGRDGHPVQEDRRLVDVGPHDGRARRRRAGDGDRGAQAARRLHPPWRPREPARLAPGRQDDARGRHRAADGLDREPVGQRGDGVAHGARRGGVRARPHARDAGSGGAGEFDCIGCSCNRVRIHSAPGNLSPEGFEARHAQEAASAA